MVAERRRELLELAREFDLIIVEDNPYGMLRFEGEPLPTLAALEQESGERRTGSCTSGRSPRSSRRG